MKAMSQ